MLFPKKIYRMPEYSTARRHPRFPCERPLRFILRRKGIVEGHMQNVSQGGLGAIIPHRIASGQKLAVELPRAFGPGSVLLPAIVRWRAKSAHGLEFLQPTRFQQRILEDFIKSA